MAVDRRLLRVDLRLGQAGHQCGPFRTRVEVHQPHAIDDLHVGRDRVGKIAARLDAVEQTGEGRSSRVLLDRAAGAAIAERVLDFAVVVDDVLLHHHQGLGDEDAIGVVERIGEAVVDDHEAARKRGVIGPVLLAAELKARLTGRRAEGVDHLAVPLRLRRQRRPRLRLGRVEQHGDVVDAPVQRAAFDAHDIGHREPGRRSGHREIGRRTAKRVWLEAVVRGRGGRRTRIGQRTRAAGRGRAVEQLVFDRNVALRIERDRRQAARVRCRCVTRFGDRGGRCADPWLYLRTGKYRPTDGVIGDDDAHALAGHPRRQHVLTDLETLDQTVDPPIWTKRERILRYRHAVYRRLNLYIPSASQRLDDAGRHDQLHQRVAARDQISAVREHNDVVVIIRCHRRCRQ